jgi:8-oxo-dGTP diphosphatase
MRVELYGVVTETDASDSRVLLVPVDDGWDLPGGPADLTESLEVALMRIIKETTGMDAGVGAATGLYQRPQEGRLAVVFRCRQLAGEPQAGQWADARRLPAGTRPTVRLRVLDALRAGGSAPLRLQ